jgi:FG-GAP-like repeat
MARLFCAAFAVLGAVLPAADAPSLSVNARILSRAAALLPDEAHWNRADTRECPARAGKLSLYCALRQATGEVVGQSSHRTAAMEEVRALIEAKVGASKYGHHLMGYNNDPTTSLADIHALLKSAAERLDSRLAAITPRTFDRMLPLEPKGETSASVSIGDLNGDGHLDLVLGKGRHWPLADRVLLNDGKGHFSAHDLSDAPDRTYSAALADLDRDGHLDIVISNDAPDRKLIYRNDGKANFRVAATFGDSHWSTRYVTLADLNADGFPDLIAANRGAPPKDARQSFVCLNDGKGGFPSCTPLAGTESATIIVAADFDGDGAIDLFVPHRDSGRSMILWNDGKGHFPQKTEVGPRDSASRAAAAGDLDGDGRPDIVVGDERKGIFVYRSYGKREFEEIMLAGKERVPYAVAIADLNRDGKPDIVAGYVTAPGSVFFNDGTGVNFREIHWGDGKGAVYGIAIGDLDGDGWPDIAAARSDAPNAVYFSTKQAGK